MDASELSLPEQVSLLSGADAWHTEAIAAKGVPARKVSDGPNGVRVEIADGDQTAFGGSHPATCFPPAVTLASTWDPELVREVGAAVGDEARAQGLAVVLGPGLNIKRHPLGGRNFEYFSEDPFVAGRMAAALTEGLQSRGVGACLKHFAVNSREFNRFVVDAVLDERTLREIYLSGFEYAVKAARPWTIMAAYNGVNGQACTEHQRLLTDILRDEWGFDGLVMSDWGGTRGRVAGLWAGLDLEMPGSSGASDDEVIAAVASGELPAEVVQTCAQRVLDLVARSPEPELGDFDVQAHDALARRAAAAGTVLLTNRGLLPLHDDLRIAVIGAFAEHPRFQGAGSSLVNPTIVTSLVDALAARGVQALYAPGYDPQHSRPDAALIEDAVSLARGVDAVIVVVGLPAMDEAESIDREHADLPQQHNDLVEAVCAANPRTVVALANGSPVLLPWRERPEAIVESYLGGQASGAALADVLYGDAEPGGRLAETFPVALADVASDPWFPGDLHQSEHREGIFVGYRHQVTAGVDAAYAFGHGLSYTTFEWTKASTDLTVIAPDEGVTVKVTVTNTGGRPGSDVVQVYRHDRSGVVLRPRRELVGFAKVQLEPGESRTLEIPIDARAFAFYDVRAHDWRTPTGPVGLELGRSSVDIVTTLELSIVGGVTQAAEPADTTPIAASDADFALRLGRPVPRPRPVRPFTWDSTVGELGSTPAGMALRRALLAYGPFHSSENELATMMSLRMLDELPLRAAVRFSQRRLSWDMARVILDSANGHHLASGKGVAVGVLRWARARLPLP